MAFPNAKASLHEFGIHVPLLIAGPEIAQPGRANHSLVSLIDLASTILSLANARELPETTGKNLVPILKSGNKSFKQPVFAGRERHTHARPDNVGYPSRAIRTDQFLYIRNFKPDRWPAGNPAPSPDPKGILGYEDIDDSPTKRQMMQSPENWSVAFQAGFGKKMSEELYDIQLDPFCLIDLSANETYREKKEKLKKQLIDVLIDQRDPRVLGTGDQFDSYPRFGKMRPFPGFNTQGQYNPTFIQQQKQKE
jgi:uncharacterized sulfatase